MSNKNKKKHKNHTKQTSTGLLGDNSAKRNRLLIGIGILSVMAVIIFCFIMPGMNQTTESMDDDNKQQTQDTISISVIGSPQLLDESSYNIWFDILTDGTHGEITVTPSHGYILQYNKENGQVSQTPVTMISTDNIDKYDYIWVFDKEEEFMLCDSSFVFENKTIKKEANIFIFCKNTAVTFLTETGYNNMKNNWDKIVNEDYEGGLNE